MQIDDNTVAIVTGAASGLGYATARALHAHGARVVAIDLPRPEARATVDSIGERVEFLAADVTSDEEIAAAVDRAAVLGDLRIVVNCAGVATPGKVLGRSGPLELNDFDRVLRINLLGTFNVIRLAAAKVAATTPFEGERGVIINTASVAAFDGQIGQPAYAASKGGVAAMTLPIARELAQHLIRVVAIAPGIFETPMLSGLPQEAQASLGAQVPHPSRLGRPDEYAALALHIVHNTMLNGETIRLDGAIRMAPK